MNDVARGRAVVAAAAQVLARPKVAAADSFVLHAPLELLARGALLPRLPADALADALARIGWLADTYAAAGEGVPDPPRLDVPTPEHAAARLVDALVAGDLDEVDRAALFLGERATPSELRRLLSGATVASLAAAAHASILLWLFPRVDAASTSTRTILRGPARELARHPDWQLRWFEAPGEPASSTLLDALLDVPMLGSPGSDFIFPIMNQAEASGVAARLLSGIVEGALDAARVRRELSRVAAWSMVQEPPDHAPYGWSHCLTMPQAVIGIAGDGVDLRTATAVAATHVVGFRSALGQRTITPDLELPARETSDLTEAIAEGPLAAAATAGNAPDSEIDRVIATLAVNASRHHDAHLVKYTVACFDAADADPAYRPLYLAAAAYLAGWWAQQPSDGFFDHSRVA